MKDVKNMNLKNLRKDGFFVEKSIFSANELSHIAREIDQIYIAFNKFDPISLRTEYRKNVNGTYVIDRLDPVLDLSPSLKILVDKELRPFLNSFFLEPVTFFKCKHILKMPNTTGYTLHQDFLYWKWLKIPPQDLFSIVIPLGAYTNESGPIQFYKGANKKPIDAVAHNEGGDLVDTQFSGFDLITPMPNIGDCLVFDSLAPHKSEANNDTFNRSLIIISFAVGTYPNMYSRYYRHELERKAKSLASSVGNECFRNLEERIIV